jgi:hypothetical protein
MGSACISALVSVWLCISTQGRHQWSLCSFFFVSLPDDKLCDTDDDDVVCMAADVKGKDGTWLLEICISYVRYSHCFRGAQLKLPPCPSQNITARVFRSDSSGKAAQWLARSILESREVLRLVIRLLSVRADVWNSVIKTWEHLYCIPLHTCQHAGALSATTRTSPTPRRRTLTSKYSSFTSVVFMLILVTTDISQNRIN